VDTGWETLAERRAWMALCERTEPDLDPSDARIAVLGVGTYLRDTLLHGPLPAGSSSEPMASTEAGMATERADMQTVRFLLTIEILPTATEAIPARPWKTIVVAGRVERRLEALIRCRGLLGRRPLLQETHGALLVRGLRWL
jgi:hypothetical protein